MTAFSLDPRLLDGSEALGDLPLSHARLQADARFPWIVLIPRRMAMRELEDLDGPALAQLMTEILLAGAAVRAVGEAAGRTVEKLNVGALGNITPQLHVHVVGRRSDDAAWPGPVWGAGRARPYEARALQGAVARARGALGL